MNYEGLCDKGPYHGSWLKHYQQIFEISEAPFTTIPGLDKLLANEPLPPPRCGTYRHEFGVWVWKGWQ